jgi:transposase
MPEAGRITERLHGSRASAACCSIEKCQPKPPAFVACAIMDGMSRSDAARIGGMDRQTLRDWVHRFNERAPPMGFWTTGRRAPGRASPDQQAELAELVETGPDRLVHGVVRWRRIDLQRVIGERFGVHYHERTIGKILKTLGFSHVSARPRHPNQDVKTIEAFKKTLQRR